MNKSVKWIRNILIAICILVILFLLILHTPFAKNLIKGKLEGYLTTKTGGQFRIAGINYRLPKWIEMNGVSIRDKNGDTVLTGEILRIDLNLYKVLKGQYEIKKVSLDRVNVNLTKKQGDSIFNYQFIVDAFTTKTNAARKDTAPLVLSLDEINILNSNLRWNDPSNGTALTTRIGQMNLLLDSIDIKKVRFFIRESNISDVYFDMHVSPPLVKSTSVPYALPFIKLGKTRLTKSHIIYKDDALGIYTNDVVTDLQVTNLFQHPSGSLRMDKVLLYNSAVTFTRSPLQNFGIRQDTVTGKLIRDSLGYVFIKELGSVNNSLVYDVTEFGQKNGFDPNHFSLKNFTANANNIDYSGKRTKLQVLSASGIDKSGFVLDSLRGTFAIVVDSFVHITDMFLKTPRSKIQGSLLVYPYTFTPGKRANVQNRISFRDNIISKADLQLLLPDVARTYAKQLQGISTMYLNAEAEGNTNNAVIHRVTFRSDKRDIYLDASGNIRNAMSKSALRFNARIYQLNATKNILQGFMDQKMRQMISLPPSMAIKGTISGGMNELVNDLAITSAYGSATVKGRLSNFTNPKKLNYNLVLVARNLETGKWIRQDSLYGRMNGRISAKGYGIDYKTASIQSVIDLASIRFKQHNYTGIHVDLNGTRGTYDFKATTKDPLLLLSMRGKAVFNKQYPTIQSYLDIQNADLFALGLYPKALAFKTKGYIDLANLDPESLNALVRLDSTIVYQDSKILRMDSLLAKGYMDSGKTFITLQSAPADATIKGIYRYTELGSIFQQYLNRYMNNAAQVSSTPVSSYNFDIAIDVKPDPLYAVLLPGLFFDKNMGLRGKISDNKTDSSRYIDLTAPGLAYNGFRLSALQAQVRESGDSLRFTAQADTVQANAIRLYRTYINGGLSNNRISASFATNDPGDKERYAFSLTGNMQNELYRFQLNDLIKLNYENWQVNGSNTIIMGKAGFNISQLSINKGRESISINSVNSDINAPMDIKIENFALHNITSLYNADSLQVDGNLNAMVQVADIDKNIPTMNGKISIDSLQYQQIAIGNLVVEAKTINNAGVELSGSLKGNGNNIDLSGSYNQETINARLNLNPIQFKTIEPFTQGNLRNSSGTLTGPISITGNVKSPEWNGTLRFDSVYTQLAQFGTGLRIDGQEIKLKYPTLTFNRFTIKDSLGHELLIDGTLTQGRNNQFNTDLAVSTKDFYILNNAVAANSQLYGIAVIDADMKITGPILTPEIIGNLFLKEQSNITFVKQQIISTAKARESVMMFVDMDTVRNEFIIPPAADWRKTVDYSALNYNLNIDIHKDAQFNIIVDPLTRDILQVKGAGQLNAAVAPNGAISITGAYNLTKGSYVLNYQFIRRKFELQEGSTLIFSGDPLKAEADITAIYDIEASPFDLIGNEISNNNSIDARLYRQRVPFQVLLKIKGPIAEPQLEFDVRLKENVAGISYNFSNTIDNKLLQLRSNVSGINKQVFGLLVMGRFIPEQSTDFFGTLTGGEGLQADQLIKASVSRFLSDALNQVASNLIKGVDISANLQTAEDYSTASQRTDLNVALTKRFLNDRLSVTVGKNFTVEGQDPTAARGGNTQSIPDITTTYKLSKDGRFMLKAYQRNQYEAVLDGYFIETGIAFSLSMDYDKFKEIIHKNKK